MHTSPSEGFASPPVPPIRHSRYKRLKTIETATRKPTKQVTNSCDKTTVTRRIGSPNKLLRSIDFDCAFIDDDDHDDPNDPNDPNGHIENHANEQNGIKNVSTTFSRNQSLRSQALNKSERNQERNRNKNSRSPSTVADEIEMATSKLDQDEINDAHFDTNDINRDSAEVDQNSEISKITTWLPPIESWNAFPAVQLAAASGASMIDDYNRNFNNNNNNNNLHQVTIESSSSSSSGIATGEKNANNSDQRLSLTALQRQAAQLPYGWEIATDDNGKPYFINHGNCSTTYRFPTNRNGNRTNLALCSAAASGTSGTETEENDDEEDSIPLPRVVTINRSADAKVSFGFVAGSERPVIVRSINEGGPSVGLLLPEDQILAINGEDVRDEARHHVIRMIKDCEREVTLTVCQPIPLNNTIRKSALLTEAKKAKQKGKGTRSVRFADGVTINGSPLSPSSPMDELNELLSKRDAALASSSSTSSASTDFDARFASTPLSSGTNNSMMIVPSSADVDIRQPPPPPPQPLPPSQPQPKLETIESNALSVDAETKCDLSLLPVVSSAAVLPANAVVIGGGGDNNCCNCATTITATTTITTTTTTITAKTTTTTYSGASRAIDIPVIPNILKVFLENGQTKTFKYDSTTTIQHVLDAILERMNVTLKTHYGLVVELIRPYKGRNRLCLLDPTELVTNVAMRPNSHNLRCLFRQVYLLPDPFDLWTRDPVSFEYLYSQCVNDLVHERYQPENRYDCSLRLASLAVYEHALRNGYVESKSGKVRVKAIDAEFGIEHFVPITLVFNMKRKELLRQLKHSIVREAPQIIAPEQRTVTPLAAQMRFMKVLAELPSYGGRLFTNENVLNSFVNTAANGDIPDGHDDGVNGANTAAIKLSPLTEENNNNTISDSGSAAAAAANSSSSIINGSLSKKSAFIGSDCALGAATSTASSPASGDSFAGPSTSAPMAPLFWSAAPAPELSKPYFHHMNTDAILVNPRLGLAFLARHDSMIASTIIKIEEISIVRVAESEQHVDQFDVSIFGYPASSYCFSDHHPTTKDRLKEVALSEPIIVLGLGLYETQEFVLLIKAYHALLGDLDDSTDNRNKCTDTVFNAPKSKFGKKRKGAKNDTDFAITSGGGSIVSIRSSYRPELKIIWESAKDDEWWNDGAPRYYGKHRVIPAGWNYPPSIDRYRKMRGENNNGYDPKQQNLLCDKSEISAENDFRMIDLVVAPPHFTEITASSAHRAAIAKSAAHHACKTSILNASGLTEVVRSIDSRDSQLYASECFNRVPAAVAAGCGDSSNLVRADRNRSQSIDVSSVVSMEILESYGSQPKIPVIVPKSTPSGGVSGSGVKTKTAEDAEDVMYRVAEMDRILRAAEKYLSEFADLPAGSQTATTATRLHETSNSVTANSSQQSALPLQQAQSSQSPIDTSAIDANKPVTAEDAPEISKINNNNNNNNSSNNNNANSSFGIQSGSRISTLDMFPQLIQAESDLQELIAALSTPPPPPIESGILRTENNNNEVNAKMIASVNRSDDDERIASPNKMSSDVVHHRRDDVICRGRASSPALRLSRLIAHLESSSGQLEMIDLTALAAEQRAADAKSFADILSAATATTASKAPVLSTIAEECKTDTGNDTTATLSNQRNSGSKSARVAAELDDLCTLMNEMKSTFGSQTLSPPQNDEGSKVAISKVDTCSTTTASTASTSTSTTTSQPYVDLSSFDELNESINRLLASSSSTTSSKARINDKKDDTTSDNNCNQQFITDLVVPPPPPPDSPTLVARQAAVIEKFWRATEDVKRICTTQQIQLLQMQQQAQLRAIAGDLINNSGRTMMISAPAAVSNAPDNVASSSMVLVPYISPSQSQSQSQLSQSRYRPQHDPPPYSMVMAGYSGGGGGGGFASTDSTSANALMNVQSDSELIDFQENVSTSTATSPTTTTTVALIQSLNHTHHRPVNPLQLEQQFQQQQQQQQQHQFFASPSASSLHTPLLPLQESHSMTSQDTAEMCYRQQQQQQQQQQQLIAAQLAAAAYMNKQASLVSANSNAYFHHNNNNNNGQQQHNQQSQPIVTDFASPRGTPSPIIHSPSPSPVRKFLDHHHQQQQQQQQQQPQPQATPVQQSIIFGPSVSNDSNGIQSPSTPPYLLLPPQQSHHQSAPYQSNSNNLTPFNLHQMQMLNDHQHHHQRSQQQQQQQQQQKQHNRDHHHHHQQQNQCSSQAAASVSSLARSNSFNVLHRSPANDHHQHHHDHHRQYNPPNQLMLMNENLGFNLISSQSSQSPFQADSSLTNNMPPHTIPNFLSQNSGGSSSSNSSNNAEITPPVLHPFMNNNNNNNNNFVMNQNVDQRSSPRYPKPPIPPNASPSSFKEKRRQQQQQQQHQQQMQQCKSINSENNLIQNQNSKLPQSIDQSNHYCSSSNNNNNNPIMSNSGSGIIGIAENNFRAQPPPPYNANHMNMQNYYLMLQLQQRQQHQKIANNNNNNNNNNNSNNNNNYNDHRRPNNNNQDNSIATSPSSVSSGSLSGSGLSSPPASNCGNLTEQVVTRLGLNALSKSDQHDHNPHHHHQRQQQQLLYQTPHDAFGGSGGGGYSQSQTHIMQSSPPLSRSNITIEPYDDAEQQQQQPPPPRSPPSQQQSQEQKKLSNVEKRVATESSRSSTSSLSPPLEIIPESKRICFQTKEMESIFAQSQHDIDSLLTRLEFVHTRRQQSNQAARPRSDAAETLTVESRHFVTASKFFVKCATEGSFQLIDYLTDCITLLERMFHASETLMFEMVTHSQISMLVDRLKEVASTYAYTVETVRRLVAYTPSTSASLEDDDDDDADADADNYDNNNNNNSSSNRRRRQDLAIFPEITERANPYLDILMKNATNLANSLSALMRTLKSMDN